MLFKKHQIGLCIEAPLVTNSRSIRILEKAGFIELKIVKFPNEHEPLALKAFQRS
jgi:RimJ/RimL family protein N-acetyltransferase